MRIRLAVLVLACLAGGAHAQAPSDAERAAALEIYRKIVSFDTSVGGGQTPAMVSYLADRFRAAGFAEEDVHVLPFASTAALAVRYRGDGTQRGALLLLAHMDVVPARRSEWERDPFTLIEEDGYFYARGTFDDKAMAAIFTDTMVRFRQEGYAPRRGVKLALTCGEESPDTFNGVRYLVANHRELIDAAFALNEGAIGMLSDTGETVRFGFAR